MSEDSSEDELPRHPPKLSTSRSSYHRKRSHSDNSSDPPYFSSDDLADASVENYTTPRRKKQYSRKWWEDENEDSATIRKRPSKRPKDSGVFMSSSDGSSSSTDEGFNVGPIKARLKQNANNTFEAVMRPPPPAPTKPTPDRLARQRIQQCLDNDEETIDLSGCGLDSLENDTIKPLQHMTRRPKHHFPGGAEAYQKLAPALKIFLSNNSLQTIPNELFNLETLHVLSVRNNRLEQLPQFMSKLRNLVELNVATNQLRYLPYELIGLISESDRLLNLHLRPNPFVVPLSHMGRARWQFKHTIIDPIRGPVRQEDRLPQKDGLYTPTDNAYDQQQLERWAAKISETLDDRQIGAAKNGEAAGIYGDSQFVSLRAARRAPIYIASTPVTYFDFDGSLPRSTVSAPSAIASKVNTLMTSAQPTANKPRGCKMQSSSSAPSLFELCLRKASQYPIFSDLDSYLPIDAPDAVIEGLKMAEESLEQGGSTCSVCKHNYILPRAEWIEYWHCHQDSNHFATEELFLPFMRRACSWVCVDRLFEHREE